MSADVEDQGDGLLAFGIRTVTVGKLPELVPDARASICAGVAAALARAAEAANKAIAPFMVCGVVVD